MLEPWITPSLFEPFVDQTTLSSTNPTSSQTVKDEYTLSQALGKVKAQETLHQHWSTWIVEDDIKEIAQAGLNHLRIPIGYWAVAPNPEDPYVQGQLLYLDAAIGWARTQKLKVMIDLHGAPGSQNVCSHPYVHPTNSNHHPRVSIIPAVRAPSTGKKAPQSPKP